MVVTTTPSFWSSCRPHAIPQAGSNCEPVGVGTLTMLCSREQKCDGIIRPREAESRLAKYSSAR